VPDLYQYFDYREFFRDYYEARRIHDKYFSYRYIGQRVGMDSSYLIRVLQGKKHISSGVAEKFCELAGFDAKQCAYFENLVAFNKAKTDAQARIFYEKLLASRGIVYKRLKKDQTEYFSRWYVVALRNLLDYTTFDGDYTKLGKLLSPPISAEEAKQAIFLLERLGLIEHQQSGYKVLDNHIHSGEKWASDSIALFQESTLQLALRALKELPKNARDISTMTMNISAENLLQIRELIQTLHEDIAKLVEATPSSDRVYQFNVQLFPLTQLKENR
jgi:uncharacterized protein (TIGR02147 family)